LINVADDLAPYYSTFAGSESIPDVGHFNTTNELADMYSVLASNPEAGVAAAQATYAQQNVLASMYGAGDGPAAYAQIAGQMQQAVQEGTAEAQRVLDQGDVYRANWEHAVEGATYDSSYKAVGAIAGFLPDGGSVVKSLIDVAGPALKPSIVGIVDPAAVVDPGNAVPNQTASTLIDTNTTVEHIVNGRISADPSLVNDPGLRDLRAVDPDTGDAYIDVQDLNDQERVRDFLLSRYGIDVERWYNHFNTGMNAGTVAVAGR
jgi:hypothetical protein